MHRASIFFFLYCIDMAFDWNYGMVTVTILMGKGGWKKGTGDLDFVGKGVVARFVYTVFA